MTINDPGPGVVSFAERALIAYARRFPFRRGKLRAVNRLWRAAVGSSGARRLAVLEYGGFRISCDLTEMLQRQLYFFGTYMVERDLLTTWVELARNSSVIVDVGANVGVYSLAALSARPDADVHAFEPTPEIARHLRETAELNELRKLVVHEAAVTSRSGDVALIRYAGETGTNGGMNYIEESSSDAGQTVTATTIDEFCRMNNIDTIDLMKIDVQGCEHDVLRGAEVAIRRGAIRTIFMELNWSDGASGPAAESIRMLANEGYRFADPRRAILWRNAGSWLNALDDVVAQRLVA